MIHAGFWRVVQQFSNKKWGDEVRVVVWYSVPFLIYFSLKGHDQ